MADTRPLSTINVSTISQDRNKGERGKLYDPQLNSIILRSTRERVDYQLRESGIYIPTRR